MSGVGVSLIFIGGIILGFSFVLKTGKKNLDKNFEEAIRNFEKQKENEEEKNASDFEKYLSVSENNFENGFEENFEKEHENNLTEEYDEDDEDFAVLMKQAKDFLKLVGIALIVIGIISFFV
jgi:lipoate-protein ligase A